MSRRFQFSVRDVLWLVLVVAAFFGGMAAKERIDAQRRANRRAKHGSVINAPTTTFTTPSGETTSYVQEHWSDGTVTTRWPEDEE